MASQRLTGANSQTPRSHPSHHWGADLYLGFSDSEPDTYTVVEDATPNVTVTRQYGRLSIYHPGGDAAEEIHGIMWEYAPAGDFYIEARMDARAPSYTNYLMFGIAVSDGVTYGTDDALFARLRLDLNDYTLSRMDGFNDNPGNLAVASGFRPYDTSAYFRLVRTGSSWESFVSRDGVTWLSCGGGSHTLTVSHVGLGVSTWGASKLFAATCEYFAAYSGTP